MQLILVATAIVVAVAILFVGVVFGMELEESPWTGAAGVLLIASGAFLLGRAWVLRQSIPKFSGVVLLLAGIACGAIGFGEYAVLAVAAGGLVLTVPHAVPCPPDQLLVVVGKGGVSIYREAAGVKPLIQVHGYVDLNPYEVDGLTIAVDLDTAQQAAVHLFGLPRAEVEAKARTILAANGDLASIGMKVVA